MRPVRPQIAGRDSPSDDRARISGAEAVVDVVVEDDAVAEDDAVDEKSEGETDEARKHRLSNEINQFTWQEVRDHLRGHWPFWSWCGHCVSGRAADSPRRARAEEGREFDRSGAATLSMDQSSMGTADVEEAIVGAA